MKAFTWIAASAVLTVSASASAAQAGRMAVAHFEPLQRLSIAEDGSAVAQKAGSNESATLSFDALGKTFDLRLEPNRALLGAAVREAIPNNVAVYRGSLEGKPNSWARIVVYEGAPSGLVWDGEEMYAIESPHDSSLPISAPVVYRLADTYIEPGSISCGSAAVSGNGAATLQKLVGELSGAIAQAPGAVEELNLGAAGDFEFTSARGGDSAAASAITTRLNNVDGIFSQQLGVQINVQEIETFSSAADPFSDTGDAGTLLVEVATYREATPTQSSQGLTHLWTGRDLDTTTVGIAYSSALCHPRFGAGLSEGNGNATFDSLIAAHEIGHNFGAPHDGETGSPCEAETGDFLMTPSLNGSNQFSSCSIAEMQDDIAGASCITPIPAVDMAVSLNGQASTLLLGADTVLEYDLPNNGTLQATNVTAEFTLPSTLTFESVTTTTGSCTNGAGTISCDLGTVAGSSDQTVTITATPSSLGVGTLTASVTADVDDRLNNNQEMLQVTVDPAVDLVVSLPGQATIDLDQSTTVNASLENRSVLDATGVTLTITLNNGLRVDSATWALGSCAISGQRVDCQASGLAAQSTTAINLGVTGVTAGSRSYTVQANSNEADARSADNTASSSIRIRDPKDDSGGGAAGPLFLWLLGISALLARRSRRSLS